MKASNENDGGDQTDNTHFTSGFPRNVRDSFKDFVFKPGETKPPSELVAYLKKVIEKMDPELLEDIKATANALEPFVTALPQGSTLEDDFKKLNALSQSLLDNNPVFQAVTPILLQRPGKTPPEPLATGVFFQIHNEIFVLTAAHVLDSETEGYFLIPGEDHFIPLSGHFCKMHPPSSGKRSDDKFDAAYCCLDEETVSNLSTSIIPLTKDQVILEKMPVKRTYYRVCGYPWRKTKVKNKKVEIELTSMEGPEAKACVYEELGRSRKYSLAFHLNQKRHFSGRLGRVITPPSPSGMSGGAIFRWNREKEGLPKLLLAGIATDFDKGKGLLIGTQMHVFLNSIFRNRPELASKF